MISLSKGIIIILVTFFADFVDLRYFRKRKEKRDALKLRRRLEFLRCAVVPFFLSQRLFLFLELVLGGGLIKFYGTLIFFLIYDLPLPYIVKVDLKIILRRP